MPEPRLLAVTPFDKDAIGAIEKAIQSSDLGITPSNDGQVIRLAFPPLTEERRKELVKQVHHRAEEGRVAVRNVRRHAKEEMEKLEREGGISEDDLVRGEKELQKLTDRFVAEIDEIQAPQGAGAHGGLVADDKRDGGDDLFEDLDKFFAPIKDVDWDEPASAGARETPSEEHVAVRAGRARREAARGRAPPSASE